MEAIQVLEARRASDARKVDSEMIATHGQQLFHDANSWVGGNPDGDVTLVEFSDYRCGYCKQAHPELQELLRRDPNIRLVVKEFPILGPDSVAAARMATAALDLDRSKYGALNDALMSFEGQLTEAAAYQIANHAGYDIAALKARAASAEIEARIGDTYALARATPMHWPGRWVWRAPPVSCSATRSSAATCRSSACLPRSPRRARRRIEPSRTAPRGANTWLCARHAFSYNARPMSRRGQATRPTRENTGRTRQTPDGGP